MSHSPIEILIHEVGREGQGVGFDDDQNIYFVRGAIPGDRVQVIPEPGNRRYRDARLHKILAPSPQRVTPPCPHFLECGGCDWLQWEYPAQLAAKEKSVLHVLNRAGLSPLTVKSPIGAEQPLHYRNRVQLRREGERLGFYKRDSHEIVDIESCAIACPAINEEITRLRREPPSARATAEKIELAVTGEGVQRVRDAAHGALGFGQVNSQQNEKLQGLVSELVGPDSSAVLELFCGEGNLTAAYTRPGLEVVGVDSHPESVNRARAQLGSAEHRFECFWIDEQTPRRLGDKFWRRYDTLILDPPRSGVGARKLKAILGPSVNKIIYVSCSPLTFSQDVKELAAQGFLFRSLSLLDMFPQTRHVELVAYFMRPLSH